MPDSTLPRWARTAGRTVRVLACLLVVVAATGDLYWPSSTIDGVVPQWQLYVSAGLMAALGLAGAVAILAHRWRIEWVCASAVAFLLLGRAIPVWMTLPHVPTRLAAAAMMTLAALGLGARALDLWVFHVKTSETARAARRREARG